MGNTIALGGVSSWEGWPRLRSAMECLQRGGGPTEGAGAKARFPVETCREKASSCGLGEAEEGPTLFPLNMPAREKQTRLLC